MIDFKQQDLSPSIMYLSFVPVLNPTFKKQQTITDSFLLKCRFSEAGRYLTRNDFTNPRKNLWNDPS